MHHRVYIHARLLLHNIYLMRLHNITYTYLDLLVCRFHAQPQESYTAYTVTHRCKPQDPSDRRQVAVCWAFWRLYIKQIGQVGPEEGRQEWIGFNSEIWWFEGWLNSLLVIHRHHVIAKSNEHKLKSYKVVVFFSIWEWDRTRFSISQCFLNILAHTLCLFS